MPHPPNLPRHPELPTLPVPAALPAFPCFLNGSFTTVDRAQVSVLDRGFVFGDGVYEVVPTYGGTPFRMAQHLQRLARSLREVRIENPYSDQNWTDIVSTLIAEYRYEISENSDKNIENCENQLIYIQVTRGVALRDHVMTQGVPPTVFAMACPLRPVPAALRASGVACVSADDFRWHRGHIKSVSLLGAVFARQISFDAGAMETLMFRGEHLTEAAANNVWIVKNGVLMGSPKDHWVLEGVRYGLFDELCAQIGMQLELRRITRAQVLAADELLLTSATKEVLAVTTLDGQPVGHASHRGAPGPVYARLYAAYQAAKAQT